MLTEATFIEKMDRLNPSQQSIETTSSWCTLWRSDAAKLAALWENYFVRADQPKRLSLLYLANDVLQNSRKKGPEFVEQFYRILPRALRLVLSKSDMKTRNSVTKVVKVWKDRLVFGSSGSKILDQVLEEATTPREPEVASPPVQKAQPMQQPSTSVPPAPQAAEVNDFAASVAAAMRSADQVAAQGAVTNQAMETAISSGATGPVAVQALEQCADVLQKEMVARQHAIALLQTALRAQQDALGHTTARWQHCQQQLNEHGQQQQQTRRQQIAPQDPRLGAPLEEGPQVNGQEQGSEAVPAEGLPQNNAAAAAAAAAPDAAAIAAQLVNNPAALLEALAALPQDQQANVTASLSGAPPAVGGGGGAEEEYDPEEFW